MKEQSVQTKEASDRPPLRASPSSVSAGVLALSRGRFKRQVVWTMMARLLVLAGVLGTSIIVAHWLGAAGLGALAVINVTVLLALQVGSAGLPAASTYFIAQDRQQLASIWSNALLFAAAAGTLLALCVVVLAALRPNLFGNVSLQLICLAAVSIPFQLLTLLGLNVFLGTERIAQFNALDAVSQFVVLANAVVALIVLGAGLPVLVGFNTAASILVCALVVWMVGRVIREQGGERKFRPRGELFKRMMRYGVKSHLTVVAAMLVFRADLLIVNHFRGADEAGVYAVATQVSALLMLLPGVISTLIFPRITSEQDVRGRLTMSATRHTAFIMLIVCITVAPLSFLLPLVYGPAFADASVLLLILLPGVYLIGVEAVLVQHFNSMGLPIIIPLFWLITLFVNVSLNLMFVPTFGARAAALSSALSYTMVFLFIALYFRAQTGNRLSETFILRGEELRGLLRGARTRLSRREDA